MLSLPVACVTVTPLTRLSCTKSFAPGSTSPVQFAAAAQSVLPAPPSQHTPVQAPPDCVRRKTLPTMAPLIPGGNARTAKLPLTGPVVALMTSKLWPLWPLGTKPLMRLLLSVPPRVALPETLMRSY